MPYSFPWICSTAHWHAQLLSFNIRLELGRVGRGGRGEWWDNRKLQIPLHVGLNHYRTRYIFDADSGLLISLKKRFIFYFTHCGENFSRMNDFLWFCIQDCSAYAIQEVLLSYECSETKEKDGFVVIGCGEWHILIFKICLVNLCGLLFFNYFFLMIVYIFVKCKTS